MSAKAYIQLHGRRIALAINGLLCIFITFAAVTYFTSIPQPSPRARLGSISIDLRKLNYQLSYDDLNTAGLFNGLACRECDFSQGAGEFRHEDLANPQFIESLYRSRGKVWLHFYGKDIPGGQQRLDRAMQKLRRNFPGREDAFTRLAGEMEDDGQMRMDLLVRATESAAAIEGLGAILKSSGFKFVPRRQPLTGGTEPLVSLGSLQHLEFGFVKGQLIYWPGRRTFEVSMGVMTPEIPSSVAESSVIKVFTDLNNRVVAKYGKGKVNVRADFSLSTPTARPDL